MNLKTKVAPVSLKSKDEGETVAIWSMLVPFPNKQEMLHSLTEARSRSSLEGQSPLTSEVWVRSFYKLLSTSLTCQAFSPVA